MGHGMAAMLAGAALALQLAAGSVSFAAAPVQVPLGALPPAAASTAPAKGTDAYNLAYYTDLAVLACAGTYAPKTSEAWQYLRHYGWTIEPQQAEQDRHIANYMTARTALPDGHTLYVVAFRGSADKKDWKEDLTVKHVPFERAQTRKTAAAVQKDAAPAQNAAAKRPAAAGTPQAAVPMVHKGFNDYTDAALAGLAQTDLFDRLRADPGSHLLLTGHSLGGAAATLLGMRLVTEGVPRDQVHVITFGAPAIGNDAFAETYGPRLNLLRVVNTADPIPGSLQAVFGGYRQFGDVLTFQIPRQVSNMTHGINLYLDAAWKHYADAAQEAVDAGLLQDLPERRDDTSYPLVGLYFEEKGGKKARNLAFLPYLRRFLTNAYKADLPHYVILPDTDQEQVTRSGADYVLTVAIAGEPSRYDEGWYLTLDQGLQDVKTGRWLALTRSSRRTSPEAGNVEAAMAALRQQRDVLQEQLPWYP
ncbi:MAG: lipase family protein [Succiniclasticum sp.]|nr:lipase family protein [Succiniclasticum sp.]MEE3479898.1 lipase family protein [Succiniclasticum sp.]